jgi:hypothetical protein
MRAVAPAIFILISGRAPKIRFCISRIGDLPAPLGTAELDVSPRPVSMVL